MQKPRDYKDLSCLAPLDQCSASAALRLRRYKTLIAAGLGAILLDKPIHPVPATCLVYLMLFLAAFVVCGLLFSVAVFGLALFI